jgi:hypothetical protein
VNKKKMILTVRKTVAVAMVMTCLLAITTADKAVIHAKSCGTSPFKLFKEFAVSNGLSFFIIIFFNF